MTPSLSRAITLAALSLLVAACQAPQGTGGQTTTSQPQTTHVEPAKVPVPDLMAMPLADAVALMKNKLRQNGQDLFCDQPAYLACFGISRAQCVGEVGAVKNACLDRADAKFPDIQSRQELEQYSSDISSCLAVQHAVQHQDKMQTLSSCMQRIQFDPAQRDQSLFK